MVRVMPSQVVQAIDGLFPHSANEQSNALLTIGNGPQLRAILKLLSDVPEELIVLPLADYADLTLAKSTIAGALARARRCWGYAACEGV